MHPRQDDYSFTGHPYSVPSSTGQHVESCKTIVYPFDKYDIVMRLTQNNEFVDVIEVRIRKDFLSYKQKIARKGFHDVEEFYRDE